MDHDTMELFDLLTGAASRSETLAMAEHLSTCDPCRQALADLVVAHAALTSAARSIRVPAVPDEPFDDLPPLRALEDDQTPSGKVTHQRRVHRWRWSMAGAAIVLVAALVVGIGLAPNHPGPTVVAHSALQPLDGPPNATGSLTALAVGDSRLLSVHTAKLDAPGPQSFYEVWLLNPATLKMLPVGVLPPSGSGTYNMDAALMNDYSAVDVSLQVNDGNPAHSKVSVLRGYF